MPLFTANGGCLHCGINRLICRYTSVRSAVIFHALLQDKIRQQNNKQEDDARKKGHGRAWRPKFAVNTCPETSFLTVADVSSALYPGYLGVS